MPVITSYSIHYTKLYEGRRPRRGRLAPGDGDHPRGGVDADGLPRRLQLPGDEEGQAAGAAADVEDARRRREAHLLQGLLPEAALAAEGEPLEDRVVEPGDVVEA